MKNLRENRAITLVALIVTIIILLILAGVTIALLNGENGILSRAEKAATSYETESIKEVVNLKLANLNAAKWIDEGRKAILKDLNEFDDANSANFDAKITLKNSIGDTDTSAILVYEQHEIEVDSDFNITKMDGVTQEGSSSGTNQGSNSGETGENSGSIDSTEYVKMQETIAQLQQKVATLETQSATKAEVSTAKTEIDTEIANASHKIDSAQAQIDHMLINLDVDTRTTLFEGTAGTRGTYTLSNIKDYKYIIIYADASASTGRFGRTSQIINTSDIVYNNATTYAPNSGYTISMSGNTLEYYLGYWFMDSTHLFLNTIDVKNCNSPRIYKIEGIQ